MLYHVTDTKPGFSVRKILPSVVYMLASRWRLNKDVRGGMSSSQHSASISYDTYLSGADVAGGFVSPDVLFSGLKSEAIHFFPCGIPGSRQQHIQSAQTIKAPRIRTAVLNQVIRPVGHKPFEVNDPFTGVEYQISCIFIFIL